MGTNFDAVFATDLVLSDGGVYDNLGLQTAWGRCRTLLVSDGGGSLKTDPTPAHDWARHAVRVSSIVDSQVRALRKRQLIDAFEARQRRGAYWGIRSDIVDYDLADSLSFDATRAAALAATRTRLKALDDLTQRDLVKWGYTICDTAIRRWHLPGTPMPAAAEIPFAS
jgi:NTE family protein